ncbi:MAG TPA: sugar phosphate isomerase/epimerase [Planctomycetota bacterium]|nr:sugar phosphate isomerase/epimerase [Planctomycetota bacterium]
MKISCQEAILNGSTFAEKVANAERYGFDGIELDGNKLHDEANLKERRAVLKDSRVRPSSICGGFQCEMVHADPQKRRVATDAIKRLIDFSSEVGAAGPISVPIFNGNQRVPDLSPWKTQHQLEIELLTEILRDIGRHAEGTKAALLLEPLNRYESNAILNVGEAAQLCRTVGGKGVKVMADFFHMHIEEYSTPRSLSEIGDVLGHMHLADNTRKEPGSGDIDFTASFRVLKKIGFKGYMAFECGLTDKPEVALPRSVQYLRKCIAEA